MGSQYDLVCRLPGKCWAEGKADWKDRKCERLDSLVGGQVEQGGDAHFVLGGTDLDLLGEEGPGTTKGAKIGGEGGQGRCLGCLL